MDTVNTELIRGHVDTIILNSLSERDRYGYEILDIIADLSEGRYVIKQPTLYSCLKRLEKLGFISSYFGDESNGGRRRYYKLTEKGQETLTQDQREWEFSRTIINKLLSDKEIDLKTVEAPFDPNELRPLTRRVKAHEAPENGQEDGETVSEAQTSQIPANSVVLPQSMFNEPPIVSPGYVYVAVPKEQAKAGVTFVPQEEAQQSLVVEEKTQPIVESSQTVQSEPTAIDGQDEEEALFIKEQQTKARQLLQIGEFAPAVTNLLGEDPATGEKNSTYESQPLTDEQRSFLNNRTTVDMQEGFNYREPFGAIFGHMSEQEEAAAAMQHAQEVERIENSAKARHFGDVKQSLYEDGFKLKVYQKANSINHYYMKFIYSNRINRDTAILTYLVLCVEILAMIIAYKVFGTPITYFIIAGLGLIIPIAATIIWAVNPTKRIRAQFNFNQTIANSLIAFVVIVAITIVVSLLLDGNFKLGTTYVPIIIAADIPIGVMIYGLLYKSNNYHLKK